MTDNDLLDRRALRQSFDQAASRYDEVAGLQRGAARRLANMLVLESTPRLVLDLGCGTGYGTALLASRFPQSQLIFADLAFAMVQSAQKCNRGLALCADAQALPIRDGSTDLLYSNCMLQWCNDVAATFIQFHRTLRAGGSLAFTTFGPRTLSELRESFDDGYTHVSRFADVASLQRQLQAVGFVDVQMEIEIRVVHYETVLVLMRELKILGANNATRGRARGLTGRRAWQRMLERYEGRRVAQGLPASYELIYASARKAA
jgi:malonyl-CoA O-methyltransferase